MEVQRQCYFLRSHLLRMAMLSQRAVDYSNQGARAGRPLRFTSSFGNTIRSGATCNVASAIEAVDCYASGMPVDADSAIAESALRIYSALYVTYTAASEITHIAALMAQGERTSPSPTLGEIARFVNSLVRLCTVALFKKEVQHVRGILNHDRSWQWYELALRRTRHLLIQNHSTHARSELAVARALGQIADQAYQIAEASTLWLEGDNRLGCTREKPWLAA